VCKIVADTIGKDAMATPECCVMMDFMSAETEARLTRASRTYARLRPQWRDAVRELHEAIIAERQEGAKIEDITARVPVRPDWWRSGKARLSPSTLPPRRVRTPVHLPAPQNPVPRAAGLPRLFPAAAPSIVSLRG